MHQTMMQTPVSTLLNIAALLKILKLTRETSSNSENTITENQLNNSKPNWAKHNNNNDPQKKNVLKRKFIKKTAIKCRSCW